MEQMTQVPTKFTAGDRFNLLLSFSDYPATTWTAALYFINASGRIKIDGAASGDDHLLEPTDTSAYAAGDYSWQLQVTDGTYRHTIDEGFIKILPDYAAQASGYDARTFHEKMVELLEADCLIKESEGVTSYAVFGRSVVYANHEERLKALQYHRRMVNKAKAKAKGYTQHGLIKTRFVL